MVVGFTILSLFYTWVFECCTGTLLRRRAFRKQGEFDASIGRRSYHPENKYYVKGYRRGRARLGKWGK